MSQRSEGPLDELQQALAYARVTMVSLAKGQPVRDLDEQLSYIDLLLSKPASAPSARVAALDRQMTVLMNACLEWQKHADHKDGLDNVESALYGAIVIADRALKNALPQDTGSCRLEVPVALGPAAAAPSDPALVAVPREPTDEMMRAGWNAYCDDMKGGLERFAITYRAMLAAAPAQKGGDRG